MRAWLWIIFTMSLAGCLYGGTVRQIFSTANTCPSERITVTRHREIAGHRIDPDRYSTKESFIPGPPPPPELRSDPERVRLWEKNHPAVHTGGGRSFWDNNPVYEARGCGVTTWYVCWTEVSNDGTPQRIERDDCANGTAPGPP